MKLGEIRNYLKQRGDAPLADVATHFDISKEAAAFALDYWVKKGKVRSHNAESGSACGSSCSSSCTKNSADENYQWLSTETRIRWF